MSRSFALLLCMTGCWTAPEPALLQLSESTELARQGEEAFADGRYGESIAAFVKAKSLSPDNPNFSLWHAMAASESGDNTAAIQVLDALIETPVGAALQVAHHNRAAYLMRMGRANQAVVSLAHAHRRGLINPEIVMNDPDFKSLQEQGILLFLKQR